VCQRAGKNKILIPVSRHLALSAHKNLSEMGFSSLTLTQLEFPSVPWSSFSTSMPFPPPAQTDHGNSGWCMTECFLAPTFNTTVDNSFFSFTLCTSEKSQMRWPWVSPHLSIWANSQSQHCGRCRDDAYWHVLRAHRTEGATWQLPLWARSALLYRRDIGKEPGSPEIIHLNSSAQIG
jgi:hypothetical protein